MTTNLLQRGLDWLHDRQRTHVSATVAIRRGGSTTSDVPATPGRTEFEEEREYGGARVSHAHDWLIAAADYQIEGVVVEPADGDRIVSTEADGTLRVFEVSPFGTEPAFRPTDPGRKRLRVHSRQIDEVTP